MTATNRAFIEAYSAPARRSATPAAVAPEAADRAASACGAELASSVELGSSELVLADASMAAEPLTVAAIAENGPAPTTGGKRLSPKRPLSQLQAEELFGFRETPKPAQQAALAPEWPQRCQQLLGLAADRYDAVLRHAPSATNSSLIGVVGAGPEVGCTTTAICLALRSSALGFRTALVEGNFASGGLAKALNMAQFTCWSTALSSDIAVTHTTISTGDVGVDLLLALPRDAGELDATARFRASLAAGVLRRNYQRVVVDLGFPTEGSSLYPSADLAAALGIDMVLGVTAPHTLTDALDSTAATLAEHGLQIAGLVEAV